MDQHQLTSAHLMTDGVPLNHDGTQADQTQPYTHAGPLTDGEGKKFFIPPGKEFQAG